MALAPISAIRPAAMPTPAVRAGAPAASESFGGTLSKALDTVSASHAEADRLGAGQHADAVAQHEGCIGRGEVASRQA